MQYNVYGGLLMLSIGLDENWDRVWFCVICLNSAGGHSQIRRVTKQHYIELI